MSEQNKINTNGEAIMGYVDYIRKVGTGALIERDSFTQERTIRSLEIYMSSNIGFLGFVSLGIIIQDNISLLILFSYIIFLIISITDFILCLLTRYLVIKKNEEAFAKRGKVFEEIDNSIGEKFEQLLISSPQEVYVQIKDYKMHELQELSNISRKLNDPTLTILYNTCIFLFVFSIFSLLIIIFVSLFYSILNNYLNCI